MQGDEPGADDDFHQVFVVETKGVHLKESEGTQCKRSVFDICSEYARKADWAEFVPAMQTKVVRFNVVDEDEWQARLNGNAVSNDHVGTGLHLKILENHVNA